MNKSAVQAENWLPWRKSLHAPDTEDTGRPKCHCRCLWAMPAPRPPCWSHSQSPSAQQHSTITTFPITKSSPGHQMLVADTLAQDVSAQSENTIIFPRFSSLFFQYLPTAEDGGPVQGVRLCTGTGWLRPRAGVPSTGVWAAGQARTGTSLHPAELKQHPPLKEEEVDTSSALLDHSRCLAPGFVLV